MNSSRRCFLQTSMALPLALATPDLFRSPCFAATTAPGRESTFDPWIEIHPQNFRHNVDQIVRRVSGRPILAVIKNNGYGAGLVETAQILEPHPGIFGFAVVKFQEAVSLREAGLRKPILLLGPFDDENLIFCAANGILPLVYRPLGPILEDIAAQRQKPVPLQVCIDTGIGRVGVPYREAPALVRDLAARKSVSLEGTMMTFTEDPEFDPIQLRRFRETCFVLEKDGIALGKKHAASSFSLFEHPEAFLDMVRPGMAIFGIYSENEFRKMGILDLRPAISLKARVIYVKKLLKGESAGYNRAYMAKDEVCVATLPLGHADGWPRLASKGAKVRINGALYPVIASVSASHCIVELGKEPAVKIGDVATFFDAEPGSRPEDVSEACGVSVYDLAMHLGALLPRRIVDSAGS
jgi:alanine racemase